MSNDIKIKVRISHSRLEQKMKKVAKALGRSQKEIVQKAGTTFAQSVIAATPQAKKKKRDVIAVDRNHGKTTAWRVSFRTAFKKGIRFFNKKKNANDFARILYRGIGKAGWLQAASRLKEKPNISFAPGIYVKQKMPMIGRYKETSRSLKYYIQFRNIVIGIGRYGEYAVNKALRNTSVRLNWMMRNEMKKKIQAEGRK